MTAEPKDRAAPRSLRVRIGPLDSFNEVMTHTDVMLVPIACGSCSQDWYRGWYSRPEAGGDDWFYHHTCAQPDDNPSLVAARVVGYERGDEAQLL